MFDEEGCPFAYFPLSLLMYVERLKGKEKPEKVKGSCNHRPPLLLLLR